MAGSDITFMIIMMVILKPFSFKRHHCLTAHSAWTILCVPALQRVRRSLVFHNSSFPMVSYANYLCMMHFGIAGQSCVWRAGANCAVAGLRYDESSPQS